MAGGLPDLCGQHHHPRTEMRIALLSSRGFRIQQKYVDATSKKLRLDCDRCFVRHLRFQQGGDQRPPAGVSDRADGLGRRAYPGTGWTDSFQQSAARIERRVPILVAVARFLPPPPPPRARWYRSRRHSTLIVMVAKKKMEPAAIDTMACFFPVASRNGARPTQHVQPPGRRVYNFVRSLYGPGSAHMALDLA